MKNRYEFAKYLTENNYKIGIEIGTYKAIYSKYLLENWEGYLYLVDVWRNLPSDEYVDMNNQENPKQIIGEAFDNLIGYENRTTLIRGSSNNTYHLFPDEFFDFIYIDANHKYKYVIHDMKKWYPKLKKGGTFAGHDWIADYDIEKADSDGNIHVWMFTSEDKTKTEYAGMFGVNKAVMDFCNHYNINFNITTEEYFATWYFKK